MSTGTHSLITILQLLFILGAISVSFYQVAILGKTSPPFRGKLSRQHAHIQMRLLSTQLLLWVAYLVGNLMLREGAMRQFSGFMALLFLALVWASTRITWFRSLLRVRRAQGSGLPRSSRRPRPGVS